jgi:subtilase family serine protease
MEPLSHFIYVGSSIDPLNDTCAIPGGTLHCYTPAMIQKAYDFTGAYNLLGGYQNAGAGQTIVIIDGFGSPTIRHDLAVFDKIFDIPPAKLNIICPQGCPRFNYSSPDQVGWAGEVSLDVEYSHAMAPAATIDLVVAKSGANLYILQAEEAAFKMNLGNIWSQSLGGNACPSKLGPNLVQNEQLYQQAVTRGITLIASSGDSGAYPSSCPNEMFPASSPYNLAVGGSHLNIKGDGTYVSESVWNDQEDTYLLSQGLVFVGYATGGQPTPSFPLPAYQSGISITPVMCSGSTPSTCTDGIPYTPNDRTSSDVAFDADIDGGVLTYQSTLANETGFSVAGGTSCGSPQWAGIVALANQLHSTDLGFVNAKLYALQGTRAFHDITEGTNAVEPGTGFAATPGYDAPTGLGSPDVAILIQDL